MESLDLIRTALDVLNDVCWHRPSPCARIDALRIAHPDFSHLDIDELASEVVKSELERLKAQRGARAAG